MKLDYYGVDYRIRRGIVVLFEEADYHHHRCLVSMLHCTADYYVGLNRTINAAQYFNAHFALFVELGDMFSEQ